MKSGTFGEKSVFFLDICIQLLTDVQRVCQCPFHRGIEPEGNGIGNELDGKEKQYRGGNQGENDKRGDQPGFEFGAENVFLFFIVQFCQVPEHQKKQGQQQQQVDVDENEHHHGAGQ